MLQRVQTLFLLAVLVLSVLLLFLPFQEINSDKDKFLLCLMPGCLNELVNSLIYFPIVINIFIIILSLVCIFLFKRRLMQIKISTGLALLSILLFGSLFAFNFLREGETIFNFQFKPAAFLPLVNAALAIIAGRLIKNDDNLVKSADRIR